jgi:hypothetical protein
MPMEVNSLRWVGAPRSKLKEINPTYSQKIFEVCVICGSKQLKPLTIHIGNRFGIIGYDDVVFDPLRRPASSDHFVNLIIDSVPEITAALRVEQNNRYGIQN